MNAIFLLMPASVEAKTSSVSLYSRWQALPPDSLMKMGETFNLRNSPDSALVCYSVVADRLRLHAGSVDDQQTLSRALTNMGYIYATFFYDYTRALDLFQESLKVGSQCNYREDAAYIYLNIGGVYLGCNNLYGNNIFVAECREYLFKALSEGLSLQQYEVALVAFLNMGQLFFEDHNTKDIQKALTLLENAKIPANTSFKTFTHCYADGLQAYIKGDYDKAANTFSEATALTRPGSMHAARLELIALYAEARAQEAAGNYTEAIKTIDRMLVLAKKTGSSDDEANGYRLLSKLYNDTGNKALSREFLFQYLQKKDSTIAMRDITMLSKIPLVNQLEDIKQQLTEERARKRRLLITACVVAMFLVMSAVYTVLLVRNRRKMKAYIKDLYRKNMELVRAEKRERMLRENGTDLNTDSNGTGHVKYASSTLTPEEIQHIHTLIMQVMDDTEAITKPDFSLEKLSQRIGCQPRSVSQVINQTSGKNFRSLLNEYRIKEACLRLADTANYNSYTIEALAETVGFNSRSNFSVTFKKITGLTPAQFQKSALSEK